MTRSRSSSCGAAALLFFSTSTCGFVTVVNVARTELFATTEGFQRSLLAAQIANNNKGTIKSSAEGAASPADSATQSVDYDAAARLAYESSGNKDDFETFRLRYLQDTSALVATKQRTRVAREKAAAAKEKAQKAAEAAELAKEKAQRKLQEVAASKDGEVSAPAAAPAKVVSASPKEESSSPTPVVATDAAAPATTTETSSTTADSKSPSSTSPKRTEFTVPRELALVPINESTVQFTAGTLGAVAGLLLGGGPFLAIFLSATANYLSRKDDDFQPGKSDVATATSPKRIVDAASQTALLVYNFLAQFERDNKIVDGTLKLFEGAVDKAKQSEESGESIIALESTLGGVAKTIEGLNDDFDLVGGAGTVLNSVGDLIETSVDKVVELNKEYKLTERVGGIVKGAVDKAMDMENKE